MRRVLKWVAVIVVVLLALPVLAVGLVLALGNTDFGRHTIEREAGDLTGGMVRIAGLSGRFPDLLRIGEITVSDAKGPYATVSDAVLDWSPLQLLYKTARIDLLQARRVDFTRLPESEGGKTSSNGPVRLPVRINLDRLQVDKAIIGQQVVGTAATLAIDGSAKVDSLTQGTARLAVTRVDSPGHYVIDGNLTPDNARATAEVDEPAKGLISSIAGLPDLGAISAKASIDGPMNRLVSNLAVTAGQLTASSSGTVDVTRHTADLAIKANAPAMAPAAGVSWQSVLVDMTVRGPFTKPDAKGTVRIDGLQAAGGRIGALNADVAGNSGQVDLHAVVSDLHIPGPKPDIFAAAPVALDASARLDAPDRPVTFKLQHPLLSVDGSAKTAGQQQVQAHVVVPDLAPLAAAGGVDLSGSADLNALASMQGDNADASIQGTVAITGGMAPLPGLIGDDGRIDIAATRRGQDLTLSHLTLNGKTLTVSAHGGLTGDTLQAGWDVALSDLSAVRQDLSGMAHVTGDASGTLKDIAVKTDIDADLAAKGYSTGQINAHIAATGLPSAPHASIDANGTLLDAPLTVALTASEQNGAVHADIEQLSWKSLQAKGNLDLTPPAVIPAGKLHLEFARLADLQPLLGRPIAGKVVADLDATQQVANVTANVTDLAMPGTAALTKAVLTASVTDPTSNPTIDATLTANGISAGSAKGIASKVTAKGPLDALALVVTANAPDIGGGLAALQTAGVLNANAKTLALTRMEASWKDQPLRLLAPAKFDFGNGVAMDRVHLGFRQAELTVAGKAGQTLDLTATLRNLPADIGTIVDPAYAADGTIAAEARITGTSARPEGTIRLTADGVRGRQGAARALPPANLAANVTLQGTSARIDTRLVAGQSHVTITGTAPLSSSGALNLNTDARVDLAMTDPILTAEGRRARGLVTVNAAISGTNSAPRVRGTARLTGGDVADYTLGAHISDLTATVQASGDTIRLVDLSGKAGPGTVGGSGSIGLGGEMPVDLRFTAANARPLASDLMTALIDADLTVQGQMKGDLVAAGTLKILHADIRIPDEMPPSVAVLPVREAGAPPSAPAPPKTEAKPSNIALNLTINAPQQIFVRGRGLDAELGGTIHITGTAAKPLPSGGFEMRQGTMNLVGSTLTFTEGRVDFSGGGIADPSIHFVATSTNATMTTTLTVSGSAKDPKITLSSVPEMPQDQILAQLLFNTDTSKLSPLQLASIASALATLSGAGGGFNPLGSVRSALGLDRLSVGTNAQGQAQVEAGRYVARGVYVGARQSASGTGTQAVVQIDLAKGLKFESTAGSNSTASAQGSASSADSASVGLTYQFEY